MKKAKKGCDVVKPHPPSISALSLWLKCGTKNTEAQKTFWSDIVFYVKRNPDPEGFFARLLKSIAGRNEKDYFKLPLPFLVEKIMAVQADFSLEFWEQIIYAWSFLKPDLKIKVQTVILQQNDFIKNFLLAVFTNEKNPRSLVKELVKESGLLKNYSQNDIIMMLCSIVADSLKSSQLIEEKKVKMQITNTQAEKMPQEDLQIEQESAGQSSQIEYDLLSTQKEKKLEDLWDTFLSELLLTSYLDEGWQKTEDYLKEVWQMAQNKIKERETVVVKRRFIDKYFNTINGLQDSCQVELKTLSLKLPATDNLERFSSEDLELLVASSDKLVDAFNSYKTLTSQKGTDLEEEKKRIGKLFTVMTDIENFLKQIEEISASVVIENYTDKYGSEILDIIAEEELDAAEDEEQIELFLTTED